MLSFNFSNHVQFTMAGLSLNGAADNLEIVVFVKSSLKPWPVQRAKSVSLLKVGNTSSTTNTLSVLHFKN